MLVALNAPERLEELGPRAVPPAAAGGAGASSPSCSRCRPGSRRVRTAWPLVGGLVLGADRRLQAVLDLGFRAALNRPFDAADRLALRRLARRAARDSFGARPGRRCSSRARRCGRRAAGARAAGGAAAHPRRRCATAPGAAGRVAGLAVLWLVLACSTCAAGRARRLPGHRRLRLRPGHPDPRPAARPARVRRRGRAPTRSATAGRRAVDRAARARTCCSSSSRATGGWRSRARPSRPASSRSSTQGTEQLEEPGFASRSAFLTSPTFGALSWLAHATLQSGLWIDSQQRYDVLVTSSRLTLSRLFGRRRVAHGGRRPGQHQGLAARRVLRLRQVLRLSQRGLPGPPVRLPDDARPVHPRRVPPPRARPRRPPHR